MTPCALHFVEIGSALCLYLQNDLEFRNILRSLYLKLKTSVHAQIAITHYYVLQIS